MILDEPRLLDVTRVDVAVHRIECFGKVPCQCGPNIYFSRSKFILVLSGPYRGGAGFRSVHEYIAVVNGTVMGISTNRNIEEFFC